MSVDSFKATAEQVVSQTAELTVSKVSAKARGGLEGRAAALRHPRTGPAPPSGDNYCVFALQRKPRLSYATTGCSGFPEVPWGGREGGRVGPGCVAWAELRCRCRGRGGGGWTAVSDQASPSEAPAGRLGAGMGSGVSLPQGAVQDTRWGWWLGPGGPVSGSSRQSGLSPCAPDLVGPHLCVLRSNIPASW